MIVLEVAHTLRASSGRDDLRNSSEHDREIACVEKKQNKTKQKTKQNKKQQIRSKNIEWVFKLV